VVFVVEAVNALDVAPAGRTCCWGSVERWCWSEDLAGVHGHRRRRRRGVSVAPDEPT
jgi:hypothetical protein